MEGRPLDEQELVEQARGGDARAYEVLVRRYQDLAFRTACVIAGGSADAEDAAQEALLNVATKIASWGGRGRFTTWLHVVAVNSARSTYRRLKNLATPVDVELHGNDRPDPRTTSVIAGTRLDLLEAMETIERDHPQFVEPLLLRDVYGLPYDEIAAHVGAPLGTVKAQIHHGRKLARPLLRGEA